MEVGKVAAETDARETRRRAVDLAERLANAQADADELASLRAAALPRVAVRLWPAESHASAFVLLELADLAAGLARAACRLARRRDVRRRHVLAAAAGTDQVEG